jgi:hypothetical protein
MVLSFTCVVFLVLAVGIADAMEASRLMDDGEY